MTGQAKLHYQETKHQQGMTVIGLLLSLMVLGVFVLAAIRLVPVYLDHFSIRSAINGVASEPEAGQYDKHEIRDRIAKRLLVSSVDAPDIKNIKIKRGRDGKYHLTWHREPRVHYAANLYFVLVFDYEATIPSR